MKVQGDSLTKERDAIGALGLHGIYAGIGRGPEDGDDYALEVLEQEPPKERMTWEEARQWAESVGGELPTRRDLALCFANVPELFEKEWYWSAESVAGYAAYAWFQYFTNGTQYYGRKGSVLRARAVRRLPI
jgi:hypothetical protein